MEISIIYMLFQFEFVGDDSKFIWVNNTANKNIYSSNEVIMLLPRVKDYLIKIQMAILPLSCWLWESKRLPKYYRYCRCPCYLSEREGKTHHWRKQTLQTQDLEDSNHNWPGSLLLRGLALTVLKGAMKAQRKKRNQ